MADITYKDISELSQKQEILGSEKIVVSENEYVTPSQIAGMVDVSEFITKTVDDLTNYYLKEDTYTKEEVGGIIETLLQNLAQTLSGKQDTIDEEHKLDYSLIDNTPTIPTQYAGSPTEGGFANKAVAIPFGTVDGTSTSTVMTATVDNFPSVLSSGVCAFIRNGVVTSASGWTLDVNGTGAKPVYNSMAAASAITTTFNINYAMLFVYNAERIEGGCWDMYYGYYTDSNSIGYQLRITASALLPFKAKTYRYRLMFQSPDGKKLIPSNTSTSTNATAKRDVNQDPIDPFGLILYYSTTTAIAADACASASYLWEQYGGITLGYSFNRTGAAWAMTAPNPVYLKCAPQSNGSAIMDSDTPIVFSLPSSADGKIYIYLGIVTEATKFELSYRHPVYYHNGTSVRLWTGNSE